MRAHHHAHQLPSADQSIPTSSYLALVGLACASACLPAVEPVAGTEAQYLADRNNGWIENLSAHGAIPTSSVLPPHTTPLLRQDDGSFRVDDLDLFMAERDVTKCLVTSLGEPAILQSRSDSLVLWWPDHFMKRDHTACTLELTIHHPHGSLNIVRRLMPARVPTLQGINPDLM